MPIQKKKYAPKNKMIRRKRLARPQRTLVNNALHPIPQRFITKMKYAERFSTDASGRYAFNLNSIFDPNRTGVGHQPYGYDTLATLYNRYRVIACGYRIQPIASISTASIQLCAQPANETLTFTTLSEMRENPRSKYILQTAGGSQATLTGKTYIPSLVGRTKAQYMADDRYQADVTTSPNELAVLNLMSSADSSDGGNSWAFNIVMEYTVEFFDIKHLVQS